MSETYANVEWETGDWITKEKMNQMQSNSIFVKEEGPDYQTIIVGEIWHRDFASGSRSEMFLKLNGTQVGSGFVQAVSTEDESFVEADYSISGLTNDLHTITFTVDGDEPGSPGVSIKTFPFRKTANMNYLTFWFTLWNNQNHFGVHSITVIAHESAESWTL